MIQTPSTRKALRFINKRRYRKKITLYKQALRVMIDKTIAIYLLVVVGYFVASLFIANDFISDNYDVFLQVEQYARKNIWLFITVIPILYVMQSFSKPGVAITTSEYQLSLLPYDRLKIWSLIGFRSMVKLVIISIAIGLLIAVLLPISTGLIFSYIALVVIIAGLMRIPQWKLFQTPFLVRLAAFFLVSLINGLHLWVTFSFDTSIIAFIFIGGLLVVNIMLRKRLFHNIQWNKVTEANDFIVWNLWLISQASKTDLKRHRTYNLFQNLTYRKKPLRYNEQTLHRRLWQIHIGKNIVVAFQLIGILLIMLIVIQFVHKLVFYIGVALMLHIYTSVLARFFLDRFDADIVKILPWNLSKYKQTFFKWAISGGIILFIPVVSYLIRHSGMWFPVQLLFYICTLIYLFHMKIGKSIVLLSKQITHTHIEEGFGFICLIAVWYSGVEPITSILFIPLIWLFIRYRKFA